MVTKYQLLIQFIRSMINIKFKEGEYVSILTELESLFNIEEKENSICIKSELQDYLVVEYAELKNGIITIQLISDNQHANCLVSIPYRSSTMPITVIYTENTNPSVILKCKRSNQESLSRILLKLLA